MVCLFLVPMETKDKAQKVNKRSAYRGILKTGVLHTEICVQSLWETVKCRNIGKTEESSTKMHFLKMFVCLYTVCLCVIGTHYWIHCRKKILISSSTTQNNEQNTFWDCFTVVTVHVYGPCITACSPNKSHYRQRCIVFTVLIALLWIDLSVSNQYKLDNEG